MKLFGITLGMLILIGVSMQIALVNDFAPKNLEMYEPAIQYFILTGFIGILALILVEVTKLVVKSLREITIK